MTATTASAAVKKVATQKTNVLPTLPKASDRKIVFVGKKVDVNIGMRGLVRRRA